MHVCVCFRCAREAQAVREAQRFQERALQAAHGLGSVSARSSELLGTAMGAVGGATLGAAQFLAAGVQAGARNAFGGARRHVSTPNLTVSLPTPVQRPAAFPPPLVEGVEDASPERAALPLQGGGPPGVEDASPGRAALPLQGGGPPAPDAGGSTVDMLRRTQAQIDALTAHNSRIQMELEQRTLVPSAASARSVASNAAEEQAEGKDPNWQDIPVPGLGVTGESDTPTVTELDPAGAAEPLNFREAAGAAEPPNS